jgi:hypothetical protein
MCATAANTRLLAGAKVNLASGTALFSVNDANNTLEDLEFGANAFLFSGGSVKFAYPIILPGSSTGTVTLQTGNAGPTNYTLTLPAVTDTIVRDPPRTR